jgi:hypothetical protein
MPRKTNRKRELKLAKKKFQKFMSERDDDEFLEDVNDYIEYYFEEDVPVFIRKELLEWIISDYPTSGCPEVSFENIVIYGSFELLKQMIKYKMPILPKNPLEIIASNFFRCKERGYALMIVNFIIKNKLDTPNSEIVDKLISELYQRVWYSYKEILKEFKNLVFGSADMSDYLDYLATEKSEGLTKWFHPPAGYEEGTRLGYWQHLRTMWTSRLKYVLEYDIKCAPKIFEMLGQLSKNKDTFRNSKHKWFTIFNLIEICLENDEIDIRTIYYYLYNNGLFDGKTFVKYFMKNKYGMVIPSRKKITKKFFCCHIWENKVRTVLYFRRCGLPDEVSKIIGIYLMGDRDR